MSRNILLELLKDTSSDYFKSDLYAMQYKNNFRIQQTRTPWHILSDLIYNRATAYHTLPTNAYTFPF